jgi:hypothetical protein
MTTWPRWGLITRDKFPTRDLPRRHRRARKRRPSTLLVPVSKNLNTRYFVQYERISISDWHYSGLGSLVLNANGSGAPLNVSFIDPGPSSYRVAFFGVQIELKF